MPAIQHAETQQTYLHKQKLYYNGNGQVNTRLEITNPNNPSCFGPFQIDRAVCVTAMRAIVDEWWVMVLRQLTTRYRRLHHVAAIRRVEIASMAERLSMTASSGG